MSEELLCQPSTSRGLGKRKTFAENYRPYIHYENEHSSSSSEPSPVPGKWKKPNCISVDDDSGSDSEFVEVPAPRMKYGRSLAELSLASGKCKKPNFISVDNDSESDSEYAETSESGCRAKDAVKLEPVCKLVLYFNF